MRSVTMRGSTARAAIARFTASAVLAMAGCADADEVPVTAATAARADAAVEAAVEAAVVRVPLPNGSTFPIASAVATSADTTLVYHSGIVPAPKDETAPFRSRAYWGDTYEQTLSVLRQLDASLASMELDLGDAVKMTVFLVGDPVLGGRMDFEGFMKAYRQYFGTDDQPNLPARSAVQVAGLANEGMLVEIELVLARAAEAPGDVLASSAGDPDPGLHSDDASFAYCTVCHGSEGQGNAAVGAPNIAVLEPWYLERQLKAYREGLRGAEDDFAREMQTVAARLDDTDIAASVDYVASFSPRAKPASAEVFVAGDVERGRELYAACAACHGSAGEGNEAAGGPRLAGQSGWYLERQLDAYMDGRRPSAAGDTRGAQMAAAAAAGMIPSADAVRDIVAYIGTLPASPEMKGVSTWTGR